jgi:hypothetical protein
VKRLIVLLIVLAGGLAAAAFAVPSNAASVNGVAISQQQLNTDLTAVGNSVDYQCFLNAEEAVGTNGETGLPPVDGVGQPTGTGTHPTVTAGFAGNYLDTDIGHQLILQLTAQRHLRVTAADLSTARSGLIAQITGILSEVTGSSFACQTGLTGQAVLATLPSSFVQRTVAFDAAVTLYEKSLVGVGPSVADLEQYFNAHAAEFDTACFTVAEYTSQTAAEAAAAQVTAGTPFATVAAQATGGGPQGCDILYGIAADLPAGSDLETLALNTVSSPIAEDGDYLLVEITSKTPTPFTKARTEVNSAAENAGATLARTAIDAAEKRASVNVDPRYGSWDPTEAQILPPVSPAAVDVLNATVNSPATTTAAAAATPSTGQTP